MKSFNYLFIALISLYSCQQGGVAEVNEDKGSTEKTNFYAKNAAPQHITSVPVPEVVTFAGETIPVQRFDVREALEHELMINTFRQSHTLKIIKNIQRWRPFVMNILKESDVPEDFIYLAVVESEFDNNACSYAGAMGMWQIMESTAKDYDLTINKYVDMRRDPKLATEAAGKFLKNAYKNLNSWVLAAASYNVGLKGMKNRLEDQKVASFFDLHLNSETARYVYRIIALKLILENPEAYGYWVREEEKYAPYRFSTITVSENIDNLVDFAQKHNTTYKELRMLNPWFNNTSSFSLKVPKKKSYEMRIPEQGSTEQPSAQFSINQ